MDDKFKDKYRISPARLAHWDYGSNGLYYITICTKNRVNYFGNITSNEDTDSDLQPSLKMTPIGGIAYNNWIDTPNHFPFIELDEFVLMPNHLHAIVFLNRPDKADWEINKFGVQSQNLASTIRGYKASVKTFATTNNIEFTWQPRYFDRIIRNENEYQNVRQYIFNNPTNWLLKGDNEDDFLP